MSLPTIESSYVTHSAKCLKGFQQPEYPAIRVALEVLNATESYLWVRTSSQLRKQYVMSTLLLSGISEVQVWHTARTCR